MSGVAAVVTSASRCSRRRGVRGAWGQRRDLSLTAFGGKGIMVSEGPPRPRTRNGPRDAANVRGPWSRAQLTHERNLST
jgi:hypothetical protein